MWWKRQQQKNMLQSCVFVRARAAECARLQIQFWMLWPLSSHLCQSKYVVQYFYVRLEHTHTKPHMMIVRCRILPKNSDISATCFDAVTVALVCRCHICCCLHSHLKEEEKEREKKSIYWLCFFYIFYFGYLCAFQVLSLLSSSLWRVCVCAFFFVTLGHTLCINQIELSLPNLLIACKNNTTWLPQ